MTLKRCDAVYKQQQEPNGAETDLFWHDRLQKLLFILELLLWNVDLFHLEPSLNGCPSCLLSAFAPQIGQRPEAGITESG